MIRTLIRHEQGTIETGITPEMVQFALDNPDDLLWLDIRQESLPQVETILADWFRFHPLAIDDALNEHHVPKVDVWHDYLYIVLRGAALTNHNEMEVGSPELDVFLGSNYLVTYSLEALSAVNRVWDICHQDERWLARGPDFLLYRLADEMVTEMVEVAEGLHTELDALEEDIFGDRPPDTLEDLFTLKRNILRLRRVVLPQRDVMQKLSRNSFAVIDEEDGVFFRDVYDHLMRLNDLLEEMLILVGSALDTYLSVVNNRMNDIMKTLTIITALFMPLSFITGFFGMNFFQAAAPLDGWTGFLAFGATLAFMMSIPAAMVWWMHRREWI